MKLSSIWIVMGALALSACDDSTDADDGDTASAASGSASGPASSGSGSGAGPGSGGSGAQGGSGAVGAEGGAGGGGGQGGAAGGQGGGGAGGGPTEVCASLLDIEVSSPVVTDAGMSGQWSPGEDATITLTLTNIGVMDNFNYPGVEVVSDHPGVTSGAPANWLFGLEAGTQMELPVVFTAANDVPPGTLVGFVATVVTVSETCAGLHSISFDASIE
jgi:hypothetical protein